jgi:hypothetical protein
MLVGQQRAIHITGNYLVFQCRFVFNAQGLPIWRL